MTQPKLTPTEQRLVDVIKKGRSTATTMAKHLQVSEHNIRFYLRRLYDKFDVGSLVALQDILLGPPVKVCRKCKQEKLLSEFEAIRQGHSAWCISCRAAVKPKLKPQPKPLRATVGKSVAWLHHLPPHLPPIRLQGVVKERSINGIYFVEANGYRFEVWPGQMEDL